MADNDQPWARRIVICCDGTWQSSVSAKDNIPSNVTKLCRLIARIGIDKDDHTKKFHQLVYYDSGIGTGDLSSWEAKRQGGTGAGLATNVIEAYNFIVQNYEPGDEIFCFGFSRGAYTARAVAGLVSDIGVIQPIDMQFFPELYRLYMTNDEQEDFRKTEAWRWYTKGKLSAFGEQRMKEDKSFRPESIPEHDLEMIAKVWEVRPKKTLPADSTRKVKVVGVWDTVGSLGIPDIGLLNMARKRKQYLFHNVKLTEHIEHAFQALALDERRKAFQPTLWYIPQELVDDPDIPTPELKQVWFPGVHTNCGGGSQDSFGELKGDSENLATATLCWMLQCVSPHLTIDREAYNLFLAQYKRWLYKLKFACTYHHKTTFEKFLALVPKLPSIPFINEAPDEFAPPPRVAPHLHKDFDFSWGTGPLIDSYTTMYRLNGEHRRTPGHEKIEEYDKTTKQPSLQLLTKRGATNEYIHPIVYFRSQVLGWDTHSPLTKAKKWERDHWRSADGKERYWWYMEGERESCPLPEWAILPDASPQEFNFERKWFRECDKIEKKIDEFGKNNDFLETLDEVVDFGFDKKAQNLWP
ncbi:hypothetical protein ACN47E_003055 [Coniothyrium glycines]